MSRQAGLDRARWVRRSAFHGFIDFNHVFRPRVRGVAPSHDGVALARCRIAAPKDAMARFQISWDDRLVLQTNDEPPRDLGQHRAFRDATVEAPLRAGSNTVTLKLSNTAGSNHGGWCFAFRASAEDGTRLTPSAE